MRFALALLCMLCACERDYGETLFKCDAKRGCPPDQACVGGRCRRGGASGQVACGQGGTCSPDQQCCADLTNPPRCIPAGDECPGYGAICDGPLDCASGDSCCDGAIAACLETCGNKSAVCTVDTDCPSGEPHCCISDDYPWGYCQFRACEP